MRIHQMAFDAFKEKQMHLSSKEHRPTAHPRLITRSRVFRTRYTKPFWLNILLTSVAPTLVSGRNSRFCLGIKDSECSAGVRIGGAWVGGGVFPCRR